MAVVLSNSRPRGPFDVHRLYIWRLITAVDDARPALWVAISVLRNGNAS